MSVNIAQFLKLHTENRIAKLFILFENKKMQWKNEMKANRMTSETKKRIHLRLDSIEVAPSYHISEIHGIGYLNIYKCVITLSANA